MTRNLLTIRFGAHRFRLPVFGMVAVMLVFGHVSASAQVASTPQSTPQAVPRNSSTLPTPAIGRDADRQPNATGDSEDDRQIGISLDEDDPEDYRYLYRLEDPQRILRLEQRADLAEDAQRLTNHGLPTIIVLRESTDTRDQARAIADRLRADRKVESSPGADDGFVILVTVDPDAPRSGSVILSFGRNALPKGGLTLASAEEVHDRAMAPRLRRNKLYSALHVGIRQIIYLETYIPEARPPLTDAEQTAHQAVNAFGPLALVGGAAGFIVTGRSAGYSGTTGRRQGSSFVRTALVVGAGAVILFAMAVVARSTIGIVSAFLLALLVWTQFLIDRLPRRSVPTGIRSVSLPYRRTFRTAQQDRQNGALRAGAGTRTTSQRRARSQ